MQQKKIFCWATGLLEIGDTCPDGALPLVTGDKGELVNALNALATLPRDGDGWLVPKNAAWIDALLVGNKADAENAAYDSMMNFRAYLERHLSRQREQQGNMAVCYFCQEPAPKGLVLPVSIIPKFGAQKDKSMLVDACPVCAESIAQNVAGNENEEAEA